MLFSAFALVAGLAACVAAQSTENPFSVDSSFMVTAGQPSTVKWTPTTQGPVTLTLRSGAASDLNQGTVIASSIPNSGSYTFTLPADTTRNSDYTLAINPVSDPSEQNYTPQFVVESKNTVASVTPSAASTGASTMMSASSAASSMSAMSTMSTMASMTSMTSGTSMTTGSMTSKTSGTTAAASSGAASSGGAVETAQAAPTSGASIKNMLNVQGGIAAMLLGVAAVI